MRKPIFYFLKKMENSFSRFNHKFWMRFIWLKAKNHTFKRKIWKRSIFLCFALKLWNLTTAKHLTSWKMKRHDKKTRFTWMFKTSSNSNTCVQNILSESFDISNVSDMKIYVRELTKISLISCSYSFAQWFLHSKMCISIYKMPLSFYIEW